ncbi:MAG: energy transducer TonB [Parvularculaceae bacterium]|nr:energy transducer TonB [Parvularculaceae bacterium]
MISPFLAAFAMSAAAPHAGALERPVPDYPTSCLVKSAEKPEPDRVTVRYDVDEKGRARNAQIVSTTDSCFNRTAIKAVRGWRLGGEARAGVSTAFTFVLKDAPRVYVREDGERRKPVPLLTATLYPAACAEAGAQRAAVLVDLTADGYVRNARVKESTDPCVNEAAIAKARATRFTPPGYDGADPGARDIELALTLDPADPGDVRAVDVAPPDYPARCIANYRGPDEVKVRLDVTNLGLVENVRLVASTYPCLDDAVLNRAAHWRFRPYVISDPKARRKDVELVVAMALDDGMRPVEFSRRRDVDAKLDAARRAVAEKYVGQAMTILAALETADAARLRRAELAAFYGVRATAHLAAGDKARALDDFRAASALGAHNGALSTLESQLAEPRRAPLGG